MFQISIGYDEFAPEVVAISDLKGCFRIYFHYLTSGHKSEHVIYLRVLDLSTGGWVDITKGIGQGAVSTTSKAICCQKDLPHLPVDINTIETHG